MSRTSHYHVELTDDERGVLEERASRYTLPYRDVVRAKIVLIAAERLRNVERRYFLVNTCFSGSAQVTKEAEAGFLTRRWAALNILSATAASVVVRPNGISVDLVDLVAHEIDSRTLLNRECSPVERRRTGGRALEVRRFEVQ